MDIILHENDKLLSCLKILRRLCRDMFVKVKGEGEILNIIVLVNESGVYFSRLWNAAHMVVQEETVSCNFILANPDWSPVIVKSDTLNLTDDLTNKPFTTNTTSVLVHQNIPLVDIICAKVWQGKIQSALLDDKLREINSIVKDFFKTV